MVNFFFFFYVCVWRGGEGRGDTRETNEIIFSLQKIIP
jgi:hypothetical protein